MKLLLDTCISPGAVETLRQAGHDVVWSGDWQPDPGDETILATAVSEERVLVTLEKDFGELAIVFGRPHFGILRIANFRSRQQATVIQQVIHLHGDDLNQHAIITAEPGKIRIRPADDLPDSDS